MSELKLLLDGLAFPESARWHDGRLWFCNWIEQQIVAVDAAGKTEILDAPVERLMGWSIDWLPDGRFSSPATSCAATSRTDRSRCSPTRARTSSSWMPGATST